MGNGSAGNTLKATTGSFFAVSWFVLLFFATIVVAMVTLSASQLQGRLLSFSRADTPFSVWQVERIRKQWNAQQAAITRQADKVVKQREVSLEIETSFRESQTKYIILKGSYESSRDEIVAKLRLFEPLPFVQIDDLDDQELRAKIDRTIEDLSPKLLAPTRKAVDDLHTAYLKALREQDDGLRQAQIASSAAGVANSTLQQEETILADTEKKIDEIINPDGQMKVADVTRIYDLMSEFAFIESFALGALYKFAILPNEFLIMVLVIAMGILGSTLQLTYDYYRAGGVPQTSQFLLRPMLGAITALVLFILLKAGVLVITDSAKLGEVAPLSPFFIAFVGIVSGFLSENALETVRSVGQSWFRGVGRDQKPRWASGLKQHLSATKTIADLSAKTGVDATLLEKWINEEVPVPVDMQKLIAVWLDKDARTLFTDVPPAVTT